MAKVTDSCPICKHDFMYDPNQDLHLAVDLNNTDNIYVDYPIRDSIWASRRRSKDDYADYIDLSGGITICQDCYDKRSASTDVNVDGHVICSMKGCAHDANESTKYCYVHYDEVYQPVNR